MSTLTTRLDVVGGVQHYRKEGIETHDGSGAHVITTGLTALISYGVTLIDQAISTAAIIPVASANGATLNVFLQKVIATSSATGQDSRVADAATAQLFSWYVVGY